MLKDFFLGQGRMEGDKGDVERKFLMEFKGKVDNFVGAIVKIMSVKVEALDEKDETVQAAHRVLIQRYLKMARTHWMDLQELEMKFMTSYDK